MPTLIGERTIEAALCDCRSASRTAGSTGDSSQSAQAQKIVRQEQFRSVAVVPCPPVSPPFLIAVALVSL